MATANPHVGDVGTAFEATVYDRGSVVDLSGYPTLELIFRAPDGTVTTFTASLVTNGTDGRMQYVTQDAGDLFEAGPWRVQGHIAKADGAWHTSYLAFTVDANLD